MKYYIKTFGCQMNHSDSERIAGFLESQNLSPAKEIKEADIVVFNTCGVRQMAEDRVYGQIHNLRFKNKDLGFKIIILTGCLANRKDIRKRLASKVDLFTDIKNFQENTKKFLKSKFVNYKSSKKECLNNYLSVKPKYISKHTAYIPIMTGCNNFCSYCVVPYARGREVSRSAAEVIKEVKSLIKNGYKEIILLGQNVNSYKSQITNSKTQTKYKTQELNFSKLLKLINSIPGNFWISFVSNHPKDFSNELIETMTKCRKVCEYVHLPLQSGDNKILQKMNRKYTQECYLRLVEKIRKAFTKNKPKKLYSITSDIIVGFPGENKKQLLESAKVMKKAKFDMVYFGQFSRRPETAAWKMKDNVSRLEKSSREKYLNEILKKTCLENNNKYVGKNFEIMIDQAKVKPCNQDSTLVYFGRTRTMKNVKIISKNKNIVGKIIKAKITKANVWNLEACLPTR